MADEQETAGEDEGFVVTNMGTKQEPEAEAEPKPKEAKAADPEIDKPDEDEGDDADLPIGVKKRIARLERQRERDRDEFASKLEEAQGLIDQLRAKKEAAKADKAEDEPEPDAEPETDANPTKDPKFMKALGIVKDAAHDDDPELWAAALKAETMTRQMVIGLSKHEDPTAVLRALVADPAKAKEIAALAPEDQFVAVVRMTGKAKAEEKPAPKPRKQSAAPDPISPVGGGSGPVKALDKLTVGEFIERRNAEERVSKTTFGW